MGYKSTKECLLDLEKHGHLVRIKEEVDPNLEMAEIQRRIYLAQGPAILFENIKGSPFPAVSNLFGTAERARFIFRDQYEAVCQLLRSKADPAALLKKPLKAVAAGLKILNARPKKVSLEKAPVFQCRTTIDKLPQIICWPDDGGAFITLPQVYSEDPDSPGKPLKSNLGMYRIQIGGNKYETNKEIGLHYQIHRGIGVHHKAHREQKKAFRVAIFVGGPPANTFSAVMPLPEGMPEIAFAGILAGERFRYARYKDWTIAADADFCIIGTVREDELKPEGPFGDHLGYYSLTHDFPVLDIEEVFHRPDAVWPFTVVGRPPQEDTTFGQIIHEMTDSVIPTEIHGLKSIHAVDAAGVHPLLLAIGKERYTPYNPCKAPQELLTVANAILGKGQLSLAKYLLITNEDDNPQLDIHDIPAYLKHLLERINWQRDLHFQTNTSIDTLDYSGTGLNSGSKVVFAACGEAIRTLATKLPKISLPEGFHSAQFVLPGILAITAPKFSSLEQARTEMKQLDEHLLSIKDEWPLVIICDDSEFCGATLNNFLWLAFTRSNPSHDIYGIKESTVNKHWGCEGSLIIDARIKPHHAPPLIENPDVTQKADRFFQKGAILEKYNSTQI